MGATATDATAVKLGGVTSIILTPFQDGKAGSQSYSLDNVIADSTTITQGEVTLNAVDCETRDEPIFENITLGKYSITFDSGDIQETILKNCLGFIKDIKNGNMYAPTVYTERWAKIEVVFGEKGSLVCPKVKLNGNIDASSLKTGMVKGVIGGTCYTTEVTQGDSSTPIKTPFYFQAPAGVGA